MMDLETMEMERIDKRLENLSKMADKAVASYDNLLKDIEELSKKLEKAEAMIREMKEIDRKRVQVKFCDKPL